MSEEENIFEGIRKSSGGLFDRGYTDENMSATQASGIQDIIRGELNTSGGTVNVNIKDRLHHRDEPRYQRTPFTALSQPAWGDAFAENAPYYAAIAGAALVTGGAGAAFVAGGLEGLALSATASQVIGNSAFLIASGAGGLATKSGIDALGGAPNALGGALNPGAATTAAAIPTVATFGRLGLPKTAADFATAGVFGGVVTGHSLVEGALNPDKTTGEVLADSALAGIEATAFGAFARPTPLGQALIGAGHYAGQNNPLYRGAVKSLYTDNGRGGTWDNSHGRGGVAPNGTGGVAGFEPARVEGDGTIGVPVIYGHPNKPQQTTAPAAQTGLGAPGGPELSKIVPTATGRGDATNYDPAKGTITVTSAQPDGTAKVTIYTNIGGQALKAKGPYANTPDVFTISVDKFGNIIGPNGPQEPGLTPPTWTENAAASEAAARTAARNATRRQWQEESVPVTEPAVPPKPAEPTASAKPPEPVVPPKPTEPPVATTAPEVKPVVPPVAATESTGPVVHVKPVAPKPRTPPAPLGTDGNALPYDHPEMRAWVAAYDAQRPVQEAWDTKWKPTHWPDGTPKPASYVEGTPEYTARLAREEQEKKDKEAPKAPITPSSVSLPEGHVEPYPSVDPVEQKIWTEKFGKTHELDGTPLSEAERLRMAGSTSTEDAKPKDPADDPMWVPIPKGHVRPYPEAGSAPGVQETWVQMHGKTHNYDGTPIAASQPAPGKPLPMPNDKEGLKNYNHELASPVLGAVTYADGKPITVSELSLENAEALFKREKGKVVLLIKNNHIQTPTYPIGLANLRKLKEHIDKLKAQGLSQPDVKPPVTQTEIPGTGIDATFNLNGETVAPPPKDPPAEDTTTGTLPGVETQAPKTVPVASIPKTPVTKEELIKGLRPMEEAPEEVIRTLTPAERQEYFTNRNEFLKTQVTSSTEVEAPKKKKKEKYVPVPGSKSHPLEPDGITIARDQTFNDNSITTTQKLNLQDKVDQHDQELKLRNRDESVDLTKVSTQAIKEFGDEQLIKHHNGEYTEIDQKWDDYVGNEASRRSEAESRVDADSKKQGGVHGDLIADIRNITNTHRWPKLPAWMKDEENDSILESQGTLKFKTAFPVGYDPTRTDITHKEEMKIQVLRMFTPILRALDTRGWSQLEETNSGVPELLDHIARALIGEKLTPATGLGGNVDKETAVKNMKRLFAQHPDLVKIAKINEKLAKAIAAGKPANLDYKPPVGNEDNPFAETDNSPEGKAIREANSRTELPSNLTPETPAEGWKRRGRPAKVKPVSLVPEVVRSRAELDAANGVKGAKAYTARFNIGGERNPLGFGGEIRGEKGVKVDSTPANWSPENLKLIADYLSPAASELRNLGYPNFFLNTHISGQESNWVSVAVPVGNGNFVRYEVNPRDAGRSGNSYATMARLFRTFLNSDGKQIGQQTEVLAFRINGFETTSVAPDGKALFKVPAVFHAQMAAGQDLITAKAMNVTEETLTNSQLKTLDGTVHTDLKTWEEEELTPPGLRRKMEIYNAMNGGDTINRAIIAVITSLNDAEAQATLINVMSIYAKTSPSDSRQFIIELIAAQSGGEGDKADLVITPKDITEYEKLKVKSIWPSEAGQLAAWAKNGYKRIIFEVGHDDPITGQELPNEVQATDEQGNPRWKKKPGPNGEQMPFMISNPKKWNAKFSEWMTPSTFSEGNGAMPGFVPTYHQTKGVNMAMTRFWPFGVDTKPREYGGSSLPRGFGLFDAPGTGKTLQMLMTAKLYFEHLKAQKANPNSPWFGHPAQPVLIVTQNVGIILNAFKGDAIMAGIALNGTFGEDGFTPNEYTLDANGGRILTGDSWIDIATYNSIKPEMKMVPKFNKDGTPKMVPKYAVDEHGDYIPNPVDGKRYQLVDPATGLGVTEQDQERVPAGPPKKGSGVWGVVMFDESHNMKNDESGRSDAGFELLTRAQHSIFASGTPIDKPQQAAVMLAMLLDRPLAEAANLTGMNVSYTQRKAEKIRLSEPGFTPAMSKIKLTCTGGGWGGTQDERMKQFQKCYIGMRTLRDEAGKAGAVLRRGTNFFGNPNIWLDATDGMHQDAKTAIFEMQSWWEEQIALEKEAGGGGMKIMHLMGQAMFESKRLTALSKLGVPLTEWNPSAKPMGVAKILLNELKEGRKVIITVDTSNLFNLVDSESIRKFKGLRTDNGEPRPYESEAVILMRWLDSMKIPHGSITGNFDQLQRQATIDMFQKNNPDMQVIIMTIQSGGTGLSIDDRSGTGGKFGVKKTYTQAEIDNMVAMSAGQVPGAKTETGSFPRSVLITSSPWGGDVFIQAMGRTDRMLSSSPTRIYAFTSHISDGDRRLSQLLREKVATTQAMVETGDPLEAQVHAGIVDDQGRPVVGGEDPIGLGVKSEEQLRFEQSSAKAFLRGELGKAKHLADKKKKDIAERLPKNKDEWTAKDTANSKRWADELAGFEDRQTAIKQHVKDLDAGTLSGASVLNNKDMYKGVPQQETETETEDDEGGDNDLADISIIPKIGSDNVGVPLFVTGNKSKQKENAIITQLYGVGAKISGGNVTPEQAEKIKDTIVDITRPFLKQHAAGTINRTQIGGILRMARDIAHLLTDTKFHTEVKTSEQADRLGYAGYANMAGRAILTILATDDPNRMSVVHETLFHEIGHILFTLVPDSMKLEMKAELDAARKQWHDNLHQDDPRRAIVMPTEDWNVTDGADRYNVELRPLVNKTPVPGIKPYDYTASFQVHRGDIKGNNSDSNVGGALDGLMMVSKGLEIAHTLALQAFPGLFGAVKPIITQIHNLEGERQPSYNTRPGAVMGGSGIGGTGQLDIKAAGRTPAQSAGMIAVALLQLNVFKISTKTGKEKWAGEGFPVVWESLHDGKTFNGQTTIRRLQAITRRGLSFTTVSENGDIVIHAAQTIGSDGTASLRTDSNPTGSNNTLARLTIKTSDILSSLFKHFGHLRSNYSIDNLKEIIQETNLNTVTDNADSINEVAQGTFSIAGRRTRYELINLNEWHAQNTQKLLLDYYGNANFNEFTHLQAAITSSLYVNASFTGNTSVTRSIMARLLSGEKLTDASSSEAPSISGRELFAKQRGQLIDKASPKTGPPDPSAGNIEKAGIEPDNVSDDDGLAVGRGADLAAGAARMGAGAMEILNRLKAASANAALQTPITGNARKWLQDIKRRKLQTGKPDDSEGLSYGYIGGAFLGTVIGQLENIAKITKNEDVAELARRLYPAQSNGLLAKPTFSEEYLATRMYFNNVSEGIIEKHNGKDLKRSTKTNTRVLRGDVVRAMTPEFKSKLAEYFLRVHNPDYNKMERMRDEIEGLLKNVKPMTAQLLAEMAEIGVKDLVELKLRLKVLSDEAAYEASVFKNGSKFDKVTLGRESDHFLGEFMHGGTLDKIMMDIGRCMAISPTNPLYSERVRLFGVNVVNSAEDLSLNWSHAFREWVELRTGEEIPDYGSSWRPRIMDSHVILDGPENRKEHFVQEAARAFLADNSHQRVTLPIAFQKHFVSGNSWAKSFPAANGQGVQDWASTKKDIKEYIDSEAPMPNWMERRIKDVVIAGIMPKHSDGLGFDMKCDPASFTQINPTTTTSDGQLAKVQLIAYRELLAKECRETFGTIKDARASSRVIDKEFIMIEKVIKRLTESHTRKVIEHRLDEQAAYKLAREMLNRINHRSTGVASSGQGYSDIFSGQHGTLKKPDSLKGRTMDTEAADNILGQFMIQDPRVFLPHYNKSVTRNVMIKHYIPESFFENLQRSVVGDQSTKQYWGEIVAAVRKITESEEQHDMNGIVKTATTLVAAHIFMPITATLQVLEPLNAGIVMSRGHAAIPLDGLRAFGGGSLLLMKGVTNSITKLVGEVATLGQTKGVDFRVIKSTQDEFLRRLAYRTGILQSTFFESLPASSADPRGWWQVQADKQVARFHHSGNMLSVVTDQSRVAVLKRSVMALEVTADEILTKSSISGKRVLDTMTPLQMQLFRNLGVPDMKLEAFLQHCLNIRALTGGDMSTVPEHQMDTIIQQALGNARGGDEVARLYENALGRWNSMTIQRNFSATQQFARALIDRQVGTFAGSMMFYLTHYNSSFARNVILPMYNTVGNTFSNRHTQNYQIGAQQPQKYQKIGDYMTDIRYPMGGVTNVARVIPPLILAIAMSSYANIQLRELRHTMRPNPSLTYADERPWYIQTLAGVDAAGFLGNLSMPINVVNSIRYNRQAAQIAAGPLLGAYAGLIDLMKNEDSIRNSPNTPTAERATAKALYDYVVRPSMQILLGAITPVSDVGNLVNFAATQAAGQPALREAFMRWKARDAGNQGRKVPTDKQTLDSLKKKGVITPAQYEAGIRERKAYEQDAERNKIFGGSRSEE